MDTISKKYPTVEDAIFQYWKCALKHDEMQSMLELYQGEELSSRQIKYKLKVMGLNRDNNETVANVRRNIRDLFDHSTSMKSVGYRTVWRHLRKQGIQTTRETVRLILQADYPDKVTERRRRRFKRGVYHSEGPNFAWHIDGHDKLKPYGFAITGCMDGFSRKIIWLQVQSTNNNPQVIGSFFVKAVQDRGGCPVTVRADYGTENVYVDAMQMFLRRNGQDARACEKSFIYGQSVSNQRIEQFWSILLKNFDSEWRSFFSRLESDGYFMKGNPLDINLVRFIFMDMIRKELMETAIDWNHHRIRHQSNLRVPCGIPDVLYSVPHEYGFRDGLQPVTTSDLNVICRHTQESTDVDPLLERRFRDILNSCRLANPNPQTLEEAKHFYLFLRQMLQD